MPKIKLKHKSPEYEDSRPAEQVRCCDMPGCKSSGEHKAPKHRGLDDYYWFCFDHAREYNSAWDFFSGMSAREVENHIHKSYYGDRPTWSYAEHGRFFDALNEEIKKTYAYEDEQKSTNTNNRFSAMDKTTPEFEAMALMGLAPPVTLDEIKTRYKALAKKYHPDLNKGCKKSEELLKQINMAYTILKLAFEEYKRLPDHKF